MTASYLTDHGRRHRRAYHAGTRRRARYATSRLECDVVGQSRQHGRPLVPPQGIELVPLAFPGVRGKGLPALLKLPLMLRAFACKLVGH